MPGAVWLLFNTITPWGGYNSLFMDKMIRSTEKVSNFLKNTQLVKDESGLTPASLGAEFMVFFTKLGSLSDVLNILCLILWTG